MVPGLFGIRQVRILCEYQWGLKNQQRRHLVNIKLKWVKDKALDSIVSNEKDVKAASILVSLISSSPNSCLPIYHLHPHRGQLGLPNNLKLSTFIRKYPSVFQESYILDSGGTRVPCFFITDEAKLLYQEEIDIRQESQHDMVNRLRKLLMLTKNRRLPLQTIDQLKWDMGLPYDYSNSFIPCYHDIFSFTSLLDGRIGLKLLSWNNDLAISHLQKNANLQQMEEDIKNGCLAFPIGFSRGFGLKRKCMEWLKEWQRLPYTSPYSDPSHLDPRTDISEKRIVGVFHEVLHLMINKKTERRNVSNLRKPLQLPQKFTRVFERHPGIFYVSKKRDTQTVILRECYENQVLLEKHPIVDVRERFGSLLRKGMLDRSRGLYKKDSCAVKHVEVDFQCQSDEDSECDLVSEYDSEDDDGSLDDAPC